jgi:hypothetical protein
LLIVESRDRFDVGLVDEFVVAFALMCLIDHLVVDDRPLDEVLQLFSLLMQVQNW